MDVKIVISAPPSALFALLTTSSQNLTIDRELGKPLLVAPKVGGQVTLFAVVTSDSCPTIQWRMNGSVVSGADYTLNDPCSSAPAGTTTFNFTLTITVTTVTAGTLDLCNEPLNLYSTWSVCVCQCVCLCVCLQCCC